MATSFSKKIALEYAFGVWDEDDRKIPVLLYQSILN